MSVGQVQPADSPLPLQQQGLDSRPYPPSFIDRILAWFQRLPVPYGLTYLTLFFLQSLLFHILAWIDGWLAPFTFNTLNLVFPLWLWLPLAVMTYINSTAQEALDGFSPLMDVTPEELQRLRYEFANTPPRNMVLSGVFWSVIYVIIIFATYTTTIMPMGAGRLLAGTIIFEGWISFAVGSAVYYHTFRLLRLVHRTVKLVKKFDLFNLDPVYAFSVLTARIGLAWIVLITLNLLFYPVDLAPVPVFSLLVIQVVLAVAAFFLPLQTLNRSLILEKRRLLGENNKRVESVLAKLRERLESNQVAEMAQLSTTLTGLNNVNNFLSQIPTWPWRTELFSRFVSVAILPIILFLIQTLLRNWLGL